MKIFLASQARHPRTIKQIIKFIGGNIKNKKIIYIPTAMNGNYFGYWKYSKTIQIFKKLSESVDIVELENYQIINIRKKIINADIIWVAGGMTGYLLYWIRRSGFDKIILEALKKGITYIGSSAGSMALSKTQFASEWFIGEEEPGASLLPGLGLIDFEIYPHFQAKLLPKIKKLWRHGELYLLKDGEAITITDNKIKIIGKKRIIKK